MATAAQVEQFRKAQLQVSELAQRELRQWWSGLDKSDPVAVRKATEVAYPQIVSAYGELSGEVAAGWYEELRDSFGTGRFTADLADSVPVGQAQASARWALGSLFNGDPDASLSALEGVTDRLVKQVGRDTVVANAALDGVAWARVPSGGATCPFCRMLASRGAVYGSAVKAGSGNRYHAHCDCVPTPIAEGQDYPAGYDPDALYAEYAQARAAAGSSDSKRILAKMREQPGLRTLDAMTDADIEDALGKAWESGDQGEADRLMAEIDARETAKVAQPPSAAARYTEQVTAGWTDADFDDELLTLMRPDANGWVDQQAVDQVAHLMDAREAQQRIDDALIAKFNREAAERTAARALLDPEPRRKPSTIDQQLRSDYDDYIHVEWLKAEDECAGVLLNRVGRDAGVDPSTLWSGSTARARKYASEELKSFWQRNGRINYATFRADALGRASDRGAREATTKEGWYDSVA